jgi:hypothetical protein
MICGVKKIGLSRGESIMSWPIPALKHEFVSISFFPDSIACSWIQRTKSGIAPLILRAYKRYSLHNFELYNLIPYNPTIIKKYITSFLQEHNLRDAFIMFCLHGPALMEQCIAMPTSTPHRSDFNIDQTSSMQWEYRYLYPNHDGQYVFYVYAVPRSLILQYELLATSMGCNLIGITTQTAALLEAYKNIFGAAFRKSQLAVDMMRCDNNVVDLISADALRRMVALPGYIAKDEYATVAAACGIICGERLS